jgi:nucleobase:cation symporter-1, NCS1 family
MVLSRAAFGRHGGYLPSAIQFPFALGWVGINTYVVLDLVVALLAHVGVDAGGSVRYLIAGAVMLAQILIGIWGYYAIRAFERYTVPALALVMAVMTVLAFTRGEIQWSNATVSGADRLTAMTQALTGVGIGLSMAWVTWASDYTRFARRSLAASRVLWANMLGTAVPVLWLTILGAAMASSGRADDPAAMVSSLFGFMTIPVLLVVLHGPIAANIVSIYTATLALLALDIRWTRVVAGAVTSAGAVVSLVVFLESPDFATQFVNFQSSVLVWLAPWTAVTLIDYYLVRRREIEIASLYADARASHYGRFGRAALVAFAVGLVAAWSFQYGLLPAFQGPLARATGGMDLSWLVGLGVAGGVYLVFRPRAAVAPERQAEPVAPATVS